MFKRTILTILVSLILINTVDSAEKKPRFLKPGEKVITEEQVMHALDEPNWNQKEEFLSKWAWTFRSEEYFQNNMKIKARLIELLKEAIQFHEDKIDQFIKSGMKSIHMAMEFERLYGKQGWDAYVYRITSIIWNYNDPDTIPFLIKVQTIQDSDEFKLVNYLKHFGKKGLEVFMKIAHEGNENEKLIAYGHLGTWTNWTLNKDEIIKKYGVQMDEANDLTPNEIQNVKNVLIQGLNTENGMQVLVVTNGLNFIAKGTKNNQEKIEIKNILKKYLNYKEAYVRKDIASFIGEIGDSSDITDLGKLLNDPQLDKYIEKKRKKQIRAAGKSDLPEVYPVREAAKEAIEKIKAREAGKKDPSN